MARYVAMGEAEPGTVAELIGSALTTLERTQEGAEAVVDAVWSHDVSMAVCVTFSQTESTYKTIGTDWCDQSRVCTAAPSSISTGTRIGRRGAVLIAVLKEALLGAVKSNRSEIQRVKNPMCRAAFFKKFLDEELLEMAGLTNAVAFVKRMKKLNTDQVYRQRKYNLLHEESEGYSKVSAGA